MSVILSTSAPRISVIVPLYNGGSYLAEALKSIQDQTLTLAEVIVVDDGSTDGSADIAEHSPGVILIRKAHGGTSETLNRGLEVATGDYLSFLDADDRWLPEKTAQQISSLQSDPELDMVFGYCRRFISREEKGIRSEKIIDTIPGLSKTCLLIRRTSLEKAGRFPSTQEKHDFMSWYFQALENHLRFLMLAEVVGERRIHQNNHGILNRDTQRRAYFTTLKESLDRRRALKGTIPGLPLS